MQRRAVTRREFLLAGAAAGTAAALAGTLAGRDGAQAHPHSVIERAFAPDPNGSGSLQDIDHFVLLMQENRSFDHYFGAMSGVRGFDDRSTVFRQRGWTMGGGRSADGTLVPFRLDTAHGDPNDAQILDNPAHNWAVQHESWNHGAMDRWVAAHADPDGQSTPLLMGYYTRADIPVHYGLADAFTVCDHYFSSVLGPTSPNRLHWMSATSGADVAAGDPVHGSLHHTPLGSLSWRTFPENLQDAGVSWKVYSPSHPGVDINSTLHYFRQYGDRTSQLYRRGVAPAYPGDFLRDVEAGTLPAVSWIVPPKASSEHPAHPAAVAAEGIIAVLDALTARPQLWERTALIISYDENGGFFDHVAPPTAPRGTSGEWLTVDGHPAPVGLGFRVPCLVISPYTRGGLLSSTTFDHTSQLQLLAERFGVPVPNLSAWRARTAGNLAKVFAGRDTRQSTVPPLPNPVPAARAALAGDTSMIIAAAAGKRPPYPVPRTSQFRQETTPGRTRID